MRKLMAMWLLGIVLFLGVLCLLFGIQAWRDRSQLASSPSYSPSSTSTEWGSQASRPSGSVGLGQEATPLEEIEQMPTTSAQSVSQPVGEDYTKPLKQYLYENFGMPKFSLTSWYPHIKDIFVNPETKSAVVETDLDPMVGQDAALSIANAVLFNHVVRLEMVIVTNQNGTTIVSKMRP
ncbi:MAG: hypothetical protein ACM3XZ_03385 [Betaproteobacteria bacterium]